MSYTANMLCPESTKQKWHELEWQEKSSFCVQAVMLPVQNASENIAILLMNFRKTKVKSEEKQLKFLTVCDQYSIILIPSHWQQSKNKDQIKTLLRPIYLSDKNTALYGVILSDRRAIRNTWDNM